MDIDKIWDLHGDLVHPYLTTIFLCFCDLDDVFVNYFQLWRGCSNVCPPQSPLSPFQIYLSIITYGRQNKFEESIHLIHESHTRPSQNPSRFSISHTVATLPSFPIIPSSLYVSNCHFCKPPLLESLGGTLVVAIFTSAFSAYFCASSAHPFLCFLKSAFRQSRLQYRVVWQRGQGLDFSEVMGVVQLEHVGGREAGGVSVDDDSAVAGCDCVCSSCPGTKS